MKTFGLQTYSIRSVTKTKEALEEALIRVREMGYTELQRSGGPTDITAAEYRAAADAAGLRIIGTHISFDSILQDIDKVMEEHRTMGTTNIGVGAMPPEYRTSIDGAKQFAEQANRVSEVLYKNGFKFTYHNHSFEFRRFGGDKHMMDILVEELDKERISFVLDTYWLQNAGVNTITWLEKLAGRVDILHLKDRTLDSDVKNDVVFAEIGQGNMEFPAIIAAARKTGVSHFVVEQDDMFRDGDPMKSIAISAEAMKLL